LKKISNFRLIIFLLFLLIMNVYLEKARGSEKLKSLKLIISSTVICEYDPAFGTISGIDEIGMNCYFICSKKQMNFAKKNIGKKVIIKFLPLKYRRDMPMAYYRSYNGMIKSMSIISSGTKKGSNIKLIELDKLPEINLENLPEDLQNFISKIREEDSMAVITGYSYDLNEDTEDEYIITYSWATAMAIFIFQKFDEKWQLIGEIDYAGRVKISSKKTKGYFDIYDMLRYPYGKYIWDGKKYVYKELFGNDNLEIVVKEVIRAFKENKQALLLKHVPNNSKLFHVWYYIGRPGGKRYLTKAKIKKITRKDTNNLFKVLGLIRGEDWTFRSDELEQQGNTATYFSAFTFLKFKNFNGIWKLVGIEEHPAD